MVTEPTRHSFLSTFRHDAAKSVLVLRPSTGPAVRWHKEPAICGYRKLSHRSDKLDKDIQVPICAAAIAVSDVGVIIGGYDGRVRFFNCGLDKIYWETRLESAIYASPVVDQARRTVLIATIGGQIACVDLRGNIVWTVRIGSPVYATPTILPASDLLVVAAFQSRCLGLTLTSGECVFDRQLPKPWQAALGGSAAHRDPYASPLATSQGDTVLCCAEDVLCLAPDGMERWHCRTDSAIRASPAALHSTQEVTLGTVDGRCLFLDAATGRICAEIALGAKITASPAVSGSIVAYGTSQEEALGINIASHAIEWRVLHGAPRDHSSFSVTPDGNFVATTSSGNVVCRSAKDGRFLWETSQLLGLAEHDPTVDTTPIVDPSGSMYCGSYSGMIYHFQFQREDTQGSW